ncbi:MAG: CPBP family intramembrane metalloprotease [Actinomyces sp.]|nr:MAG: CPBP family intramembrane metalloprotease [Actinomyces sp.]
MVATPTAGERLAWSVAGLVAGVVASGVVGAAVLAAGGYDVAELGARGAAVGDAAMRVALGHLDVRRPGLAVLAVLQIPLWAGLLAPVWWGRRRGLDARRHLAWSARRGDILWGTASGVVLQLLVVPAVYVPIFWAFGELDVEAPARSLVGRVDGPVDVVALVIITVVGAPLVEEVFFRGLLHGALRDGVGVPAAVVVSSLVFAASHFQLVQLPALVVVGLAHAGWREGTGRLAPAVWSHVAFNTVTVVLLLGR